MRLSNLVPSFLKPALRPVYDKLRIMATRHKSLDELHEYWRKPYDGDNLPWEDYSGKKPDEKLRSMFLVDLIRKHVREDARILEIGCNVGRNLHYLFESGFKNLGGIEISKDALRAMKSTFPEMEKHVTIYSMPVEKAIKAFSENQYDVTFTMAVLEHIHSDSEWIFPEIVRVTKQYLITIEDEETVSWRHFPRQYRKIFEMAGMNQTDEIRCNRQEHGLGGRFHARVFLKPHNRQSG
jgi:SAM-dependent methyltransferase